MLLIRRLWLLPALSLTCLFYFLYQRAQQTASQLQYDSSPKGDRIHWKKHPERYPIDATDIILLPTNPPIKIPQIQFNFGLESSGDRKVREERLAAVKESFVHSWKGYKDHAWLRDEVAPLSGGWRNTFGGWAATLVDTLDTLWIMGMKEDFAHAVQAVEKIDFTTTEESVLNVFETTIRYLGGFLSAYDLSEGKYTILLTKAIELGDMIYSAFDTPNRMPMTRWDWMRWASTPAVRHRHR